MKYPWDQWLARRRRRLQRGADYACSQSAMAQQIRNAAVRLGLRVSLVDVGDGLIITVKKRRMRHAKPRQILPVHDLHGR